MAKTLKLVSLGAGEIDPISVSEYRGIGGYRALEKAFSMRPKEIIGEVLEAKLLGRGGAAYPAGKKWAQLYDIHETPKYIVCNADEGEPGTFKDRLIMEKLPLRLIEGMTIAGLVFGSEHGYIYVRGEYRKIQKVLLRAIEAAKKENLLGKGIMGSSFSFDIEIVSGAGAYVCGENSALLNSTEGRVGRPRIKPPHLAEVGLFLMPTLVNNVESLASIPSIVVMGGKEYLSLGHPDSGGTKLVCLSGRVTSPGVYEVPLGKVSLRDLIFDEEFGGGIQGEGEFKFVHLGGQSGAIASKALLDTVYSYSDLRKVGLTVGSGALVVMDSGVSILEYLKKVSEFFVHESCGKCVPCRQGNRVLLKFLARLSRGSLASEGELLNLKRLISAMSRASFCGLGQTSATALKSAWKAFPAELERPAAFDKLQVGAFPLP
ncbi:MAG: NADH-quinone oxidoreductase subunit F [Deltaproteobacteria bacterium]|nr:NADH-quinone oxidoreductase subunit F [Deltaproteobacteria bacterium]